MADRPHGTYARYVLDRCRCYACAYARSQYEADRQAAIAAGTWQPFVDSPPVRAHIEAHSAAGIGYKRLAELAGVGKTAVASILFGRRGRPPSDRCRRETAEKLLAVPIAAAPLADHAIIDATGTHRRIQALCVLGWSLSKQAARIGWATNNYAGLLDQPRVIVETARLVTGLYDQLSMTPAPVGYSGNRTRHWAAAQGWLPALAWDDDTIDNPDATPHLGLVDDGEDADEGLVWLALHGHLERGELPDTERAVYDRHQRDTRRLAVAA